MTHDYTPGDMLATAIQDTTLTELSAELVAAYVSGNSVRPSEIPGLLRSVYDALEGLGKPVAEVPAAPLIPAVPIKKSVHEDYIISLIDGRRYRSMKRHIGTHGYTPESYRKAFGLDPSYPMVAPSYSDQRSAMAKETGLGQKRRAA